MAERVVNPVDHMLQPCLPCPPGRRRRPSRRTLLLAALLALIVLSGGCGRGSVAEFSPGQLTEQTLFTGGTGGYFIYRAPVLLVTEAGTVLAFAEGRRNSRRDNGDIDFLLRRSQDGGQTWSPPQLLIDFGPDTCGNPAAVQDRDTGTIWLFVVWNRGEDEESEIVRGESRDTRRPYVFASRDDGRTWSPPREITDEVKSSEMRWYDIGPGRAIQLRYGPHRGRLLVPGDHSYPVANGKFHGVADMGGHVFYSDDHGETWHLGGMIRPGAAEPQLAELAGGQGRVLANLRSFGRNGHRLQAISDDGGDTWTAPREMRSLIEPRCQGSLLRYSWPQDPTGDLLLFTNPASRQRENLVVRASRDGGRTWPRGLVIHRGPASYSCLARMSAGRVGCLYEAGDSRLYERIVLATFPVAALGGDQPR